MLNLRSGRHAPYRLIDGRPFELSEKDWLRNACYKFRPMATGFNLEDYVANALECQQS